LREVYEEIPFPPSADGAAHLGSLARGKDAGCDYRVDVKARPHTSCVCPHDTVEKVGARSPPPCVETKLRT
jgi:hypothetical protein